MIEMKFSLNAPFGARCFLTHQVRARRSRRRQRLNAPFGARCFLTPRSGDRSSPGLRVLIHLLALGAF